MVDSYQVITDTEVLGAVENRARQLEQELAANRLYLAETQADPHGTGEQVTHYTNTIESLVARLEVVYGRHDALKARIDAEAEARAAAGDEATASDDVVTI